MMPLSALLERSSVPANYENVTSAWLTSPRSPIAQAAVHHDRLASLS